MADLRPIVSSKFNTTNIANNKQATK